MLSENTLFTLSMTKIVKTTVLLSRSLLENAHDDAECYAIGKCVYLGNATSQDQMGHLIR